MPLFRKMGRKQASLLWGRGGEKPSVLWLGLCIFIAIRSLHQEARARVDAVNAAHTERARSPHGHSSSVHACRLEWRWHHSYHQVAGLEAPHLLLTHPVAARKAFCCPVGATMLASARGFDPRPKRARFQRVRPPVQVPTGHPQRRRASTSTKRVALTAAASRKGRLALASTSGWPNS